MDEQNWIKYGAIGLAIAGFLLIVGFALTVGDGLDESSWAVEELVIDGTPTTVVDGTSLTALFENGTVGGSAGCNGYNAAYETDSDSITIGPAVSTLIFCEQPDGTMDQETAYLSLLQSADSFDIDGDTLTLSSGDSVVIRYAALVVELR
ncbi:MAG: hypothetical protein BMS9Abin17_1272 [Acidimicrobiia bacterium]|nr:MAG: hypothetical protein BMS9Abin17_1272 [Acidimicrobiia bacterium]